MPISPVPSAHRSLVFAAVGGLAVWLAADTAHASMPCYVTEADDDINLAGSLRYCIDQVNQGVTDQVEIQDFHWYAPNTPLVIERSAHISGYGRIVMPGEEFVGDSLFVVGTPCPGPACGGFASVEIEGLEIAAVGVTDVRGIDLHAGHELRLEDVQLYEFAISGSSGGCVRAGQQSSLEIVGSTLEGCMASDGGAVFSEATDTKITTSSFVGNDADWNGGAVAIGTANFFARSLVVEGSSFSNNAAHWGGAIKASGTPIAVEVVDTHLVGNTATVRGGGVYGKGSFEGCVIEGNQAGVWGGGLNLVESGTVRDSTLWGNFAREGGGVAFQPAGNFELRLEHSTVAHNTVGGDGARGAGLAVTGGDTRVLNSTFTENLAKDDVADALGGGVAVLGGKLAAEHATFAYNTATVGGGIYASSGAVWVEIRSSMVVHSRGDDCKILSGSSTVTSLDTDGSCAVDFTADPKLDAFGDHGGPTWTWWPTSPSVLDVADCISGVDQRYEPRPDEKCDIGALEQ